MSSLSSVRKRKILIAAAALILLDNDDDEHQHERRKKREMWVQDLYANRESSGFFADFNSLLRIQDPELFKNFIRMNADDFKILVDRVRPLIIKKDTKFRKAITVEERLVVTLRYLATGESMASLRFLFKMSDSTISRIIHETCPALYQSLKGEFLKVKLYHTSLNITYKIKIMLYFKIPDTFY